MKKQILKSALIAVVGVGLLAGSALAAPIDQLQYQLDIRTQGYNAADPTTGSSIDVNTDMIAEGNDAYWKVTGSSTSSATLVFKLGSYNPTISFGIYDTGDNTNYLELFPNTVTAQNFPYSTSTLTTDGAGGFTTVRQTSPTTWVGDSATFSGSTFGYYIYVGATGQTYYSDSLMNTADGGADHMYAYQGTGDQFSVYNNGNYATWNSNEFILAWEDLAAGEADWNFTDYTVMVESVEPVPEPATMLLFGTGLLGLAAAARRRKIN